MSLAQEKTMDLAMKMSKCSYSHEVKVGKKVGLGVINNVRYSHSNHKTVLAFFLPMTNSFSS